MKSYFSVSIKKKCKCLSAIALNDSQITFHIKVSKDIKVSKAGIAYKYNLITGHVT
jgi:hypothetical protein